MTPLALLPALTTLQVPGPAELLRTALVQRIARDRGATVTVVHRDPASGPSVAINPDLRIHAAIGRSRTLQHLAPRMIVRSGNLAPNRLIEQVGSRNVTALIRHLGADSMGVLHGVEDG